MVLSLKKILSNNAPLKVFSLILGYLVWSIFSSGSARTITQELSICFYNIPKTCTINSPETLKVTLAATRADLYTLNYDALAIHINARDLHIGSNPITLNNDTLFLPDTIKLVHYTPAPLIVEMTEIEK